MKTTTLLLTVGLMLAGTFPLRAAVEFDWAYIGDAGNAEDTGGYGAVDYEFRLATTEVSLGQYTAFLNATAQTDLYGLYHTSMGLDTFIQGISRSGASGSYTYSVIGTPDRPVSYVSVYDAMRFINWLHNGQGSGSTETGAYTLSNGAITSRSRTGNVATLTTSAAHTLSVGDQVTVSGVDSEFNGTFVVTAVTGTTFSYTTSTSGTVAETGSSGSMTGASAQHSEGAKYWLPTEDEWYKAAYYDPTKDGTGGYWLHATQSDVLGGNKIGVANAANYYDENYARTENGLPTYLSDGGAYGAASYYGTFDQGGNVWEWNEALVTGSSRGLRGGSWTDNESYLRSSYRNFGTPTFEYSSVGFRVASIPEPSHWLLMALGGAALLARRARKATL